ncbi:MAG: hypothetical protein WB492_13095 [Christiangramia sp.]
MKKVFKPASLLFNVLCLLVFFILGMYYAGWIEAGKHQGLAGGAIVLGWGALFAVIAFISSFFLTSRVIHRRIVAANWVLFVLLLVGYGITHYRFIQRDKLQKERNKPYNKKIPTEPTKTVEPTAMLSFVPVTNLKIKLASQREKTMGMGYFLPNFYEDQTLYFYSNPNFEKSLPQHLPLDSITFKRNKYNQFEIATAPPWLRPEILKLDYDMLYFKIESVTNEFVEVIVNTQNNLTYFVNKRSGDVVYWQDFLLGVNSVEFFPDSKERIRERPFSESGIINTEYQFLRPIRIKEDWAEVILMNGNFQKVGTGWIQWRRDNKLLIMYNLLS